MNRTLARRVLGRIGMGVWCVLLAATTQAANVEHLWDFEGASAFDDRVGLANGAVSPSTSVTLDVGHNGGTAMRTQAAITADDLVDIDDTQFLDLGTEAFAMTYWFNMTDDGFDDPRGFFDFSGNGGDGPQSLYIDRGGNADNLAFRVDGSTGFALAFVPGNHEDSNWHFVAANYDPSGLLEVHFDGLGVDASASTAGVGSVVVDMDLFLGTFNFNPDAPGEFKGLDGRLDDVAVYRGLLSDDQIAGLFDGSLVPTDIVEPLGVDGDFDDDGDYDCADVDALVAEIVAGSNTGVFDLNADGSVNGTDLTDWLAEAGAANGLPGGAAYPQGDANLDGSVDVTDFNVWNSSKFTNTAAWCSGDFNADGVVDVGDFNIWNSNKFTGPGAGVVPEPSGLVGVAIGALVAAGFRRRFP